MIQVRSIDGVEYIEEDGLVYEDAVGSWGLDRIDQDDLPLDDEYNPPGNFFFLFLFFFFFLGGGTF